MGYIFSFKRRTTIYRQDFNSGYQQPVESRFRAAMEDRHTPQLEEEIDARENVGEGRISRKV
jgi:hypothetical protein